MFGASVAMTQGQEDQNWKGIEWMPQNVFFSQHILAEEEIWNDIETS